MYDCDKGKLKIEIAACVSVCVCTAELCRDVFKKKKKIMYQISLWNAPGDKTV